MNQSTTAQKPTLAAKMIEELSQYAPGNPGWPAFKIELEKLDRMEREKGWNAVSHHWEKFVTITGELVAKNKTQN